MPKHDDKQLTTFQTQVIVGSLLGDMSASKSKNGRNFYLSCYHSKAQADWLERKWAWLQPLTRPIQYTNYKDSRNGKRYPGGRFHTVSASCFTEIASHYYVNGQKIIPHAIGELMTHPVALAVLICDDGGWDKAGIQIATKQFTLGGNEHLADVLRKNFDISVTVQDASDYPFIRITAVSVEKVFEMCRDYAPQTLWYKFGGGNYQTALTGKTEKVCPVCNTIFECYESSNQVYCDRPCAVTGRPNGYDTRTRVKQCPICFDDFKPYNKRQKTCIPCRDKPFPYEVCIVCGNPASSRGSKTCSPSCNVKAGHMARKR